MAKTITVQTQFQQFLDDFVPQVAEKTTQMFLAHWELETTGRQELAEKQAQLETELRLLFSDPQIYQQLLAWQASEEITDPLLARQLDVLIRSFKGNMLPKDLLTELAERRAELQQRFIRFRPTLNGQQVSNNDIDTILRDETDVVYRKAAWEASKQIGAEIAPAVLETIRLRNQAAQTLGYANFYQMQLALQEIEPAWLQRTFQQLAQDSAAAFDAMRAEVDQALAQRFGVPEAELGPWAWADPFGQEDPLGSPSLDDLLQNQDIVALTVFFFDQIGLDIRPILEKSDLYEREGKNPHAFCLDVDRSGDVRILANVRPSLRWLDTMLHEAGHAVYDLGISRDLPWLLRTQSHMLTTEAIALLMGSQTKEPNVLRRLLSLEPRHDPLLVEAYHSEKRYQLIFSRWVLVMTTFEAALYENPEQDLNQLWWHLVERYQKIHPPARPAGAADWAAKIHLVLYPVYYHNYLLGHLYCAQLLATIQRQVGSTDLMGHPEIGTFLQTHVFAPGNSVRWDTLVEQSTGEPLTPRHWAAAYG